MAPGDAGAVAAALLTGLRAGISDGVWRDMQRSSLAHLLSISGLHMALVASTIFLALRYGLALVPPLALRLTIKKLAALGALAGATFYLLLSGASVPAQRSYLMVAAGLLAILVDRQPISMRLLACAAILVLVLRPESLLGASFQLSFAAVLALVAVYETGGLGTRPGGATSAPGAALRHLRGIGFTTLVASTATAPLTGYHFQTIATYGVLANLVAVPVTDALGDAGGPARPPADAARPRRSRLPADGLGRAGWSWGPPISWRTCPGPRSPCRNGRRRPSWRSPPGGLWLALWRRPWRFCGLVPIAAAVPIALLAPQPSLVVDRWLDMAAVRAPWGVVRLAAWQRDGFVEGAWLRALGASRREPWPEEGTGSRWRPRLRPGRLHPHRRRPSRQPRPHGAGGARGLCLRRSRHRPRRTRALPRRRHADRPAPAVALGRPRGPHQRQTGSRSRRWPRAAGTGPGRDADRPLTP